MSEFQEGSTSINEQAGREIKQWWDERENEASAFMAARAASGALDHLVGVAAQHPSVDGLYPNEEYRLRLEEAIRLSHKPDDLGEVHFAVFGSRHVNDTSSEPLVRADRVALYDVGTAYLVARGIPLERVHPEWVALYKGSQGAYNGADEAFIAASAFKDNPRFRDLSMVASPGQLARSKLNFVANGVVPVFEVPESVKDLVHQHHGSELRALFTIMPTLLFDPTWQGEDSEFGRKSREGRMPSDGTESKIPLDHLIELYIARYGRSQS